MKQLPSQAVSEEWSASGYFLENLLATAKKLGLSTQSLIEKVGIDVDVSKHHEQHYPLALLFSLYEAIHKQTKDDDIGIRHTLNGHPCGMGLLGITAYSAPTVKAAWETVMRFRHLILNTGNTQILDQGRTICIRWYPYSRSVVSSRFFVDQILSGWVLISRELSGQNIAPVAVTLSYKKPIISALFKNTYGTNIKYNETYNSITFLKKDLSLPNIYANDKVFKLLCAQAERDIIHFKEDYPFSEQLEYYIREQLPQAKLSIDIIAEQMHVSPRTLQRKLLKENTKFNELITNIRHELALNYLQSNNLSTLDIALLLGYNQASSFCTAFKSWTGQTPSEYREEGPVLPATVETL